MSNPSDPSDNLPRFLECLAAFFVFLPVILLVGFFSGAWQPHSGAEGSGLYWLYMLTMPIPVACLILAGLVGLMRLIYGAGRRSTQDIEALRKEDRRQEYLKLKEEFEDNHVESK